VRGFREGWAWTPRRWTQVTDDTGVGDPRAATAEKGERYLEAAVAQVSGFLQELVAADPDRLYE
jgi:creatinine amidohydrolase